jgi:hypothetical protein
MYVCVGVVCFVCVLCALYVCVCVLCVLLITDLKFDFFLKVGLHTFCRNISVGVLVYVCVCACVSLGFLTCKTRTHELRNTQFDGDFS